MPVTASSNFLFRRDHIAISLLKPSPQTPWQPRAPREKRKLSILFLEIRGQDPLSGDRCQTFSYLFITGFDRLYDQREK